MKAFPLNCSDELSELTTEIKIATPERASEIIYRTGYLLVFAGYGDAAYEALSYLRSSNLRLNPYLEYAIKSYDSLVLNLCNALAIDSPELSTQPSMSVVDLSKFIHQQDRDRRSNFLFEKNFGVYLSSEMENCIRAQSEAQAKDSLVKWWRRERCFHSIHKLIVSIPIMQALLSGALQSDIQISSAQVDEFIHSVRNYQYISQPLFIPLPSDWSHLLEKWNDKMFFDSSEGDLETYAEWYPDEFAKQDCTKPPASGVDIQSLEQRLGRQLPPSYRNFLLASNGWTFMQTFKELFNVQEVDWLNNLAPWLADWEGSEISDEEYFDYSDLRYHSGIRRGHMESVLQISSIESGYVYLLNPLIIDERGEWECFDFGTKISGGHRYRSFWDMIHKFYRDGTD
jgi:cell wall assembly regulator SMI1